MKPVFGVEELRFLQRAVREVLVPPHVGNYTARLVLATQPQKDSAFPQIRQFVRYGAGPRGAQALILAAKARALTVGRFNVSLDDIQQLTGPALRHRIALNFEGYHEGIQVDDLLEDLIAKLPVDMNTTAKF